MRLVFIYMRHFITLTYNFFQTLNFWVITLEPKIFEFLLIRPTNVSYIYP